MLIGMEVNIGKEVGLDNWNSTGIEIQQIITRLLQLIILLNKWCYFLATSILKSYTIRILFVGTIGIVDAVITEEELVARISAAWEEVSANPTVLYH